MRNGLPGKAGSASPPPPSNRDPVFYKGFKYQDSRFAEYYDTKHEQTLVRRVSLGQRSYWLIRPPKADWRQYVVGWPGQ